MTVFGTSIFMKFDLLVSFIPPPLKKIHIDLPSPYFYLSLASTIIFHFHLPSPLFLVILSTPIPSPFWQTLPLPLGIFLAPSHTKYIWIYLLLQRIFSKIHIILKGMPRLQKKVKNSSLCCIGLVLCNYKFCQFVRDFHQT